MAETERTIRLPRLDLLSPNKQLYYCQTHSNMGLHAAECKPTANPLVACPTPTRMEWTLGSFAFQPIP